jgi:hypothetical protein
MKRISVLTIAALVVALLTAVAQTGSGQRLPKKELHALLMSAKTPQEHQKLAAHYRAEAERLNSEAKEHEEMAEMYRKNPGGPAAKHPYATGEQHCRDIAKRYRESAAKMQALTTLHEDMAKKSAQ